MTVRSSAVGIALGLAVVAATSAAAALQPVAAALATPVAKRNSLPSLFPHRAGTAVHTVRAGAPGTSYVVRTRTSTIPLARGRTRVDFVERWHDGSPARLLVHRWSFAVAASGAATLLGSSGPVPPQLQD
jgi:hypothetical protein